MCGICGVVSARGRVDRDRLAAMSAKLTHRGPDSEGTFVDGGVGLAARRLAIIDLDSGDQPISSEDGTATVVQNGEIYNYRELTRELERAGHRFATRSDTETLVHAYEEWGLGFAARLRGMFAVAIWDATRRRLVLARDRFGIKPLYYRADDVSLAFASELDALPRGELDLDALEAFLAFNAIPAPLSIFREIRKLPAGHLLTWEDSRSELQRFARPGPLPARHETDEAELVEECRARLRDSVRAHLVADVPVGVLLSGGVDSGALAALAAQESSDAVRTFSIGFDEASFDELSGARAVATRYGTRHRELVVRPDAALLLPALADAFDEPFADSSALPTYLVSKLAAEDVKVALSGEGGDRQLFGGYYPTSPMLAERVARSQHSHGPRSSGCRRRRVRRASTTRRSASFARAHLPPLERHHGWKEIFSADARAELTGRRHTSGIPSRCCARASPRPRGTRCSRGCRTSTPARTSWTICSSRRIGLDGVVARNARAVHGHCRRELAFSLPARHKVRGFSKKRLLRKAVEPLLPAEVVERSQARLLDTRACRPGCGASFEPFARESRSQPETLRRQGYLEPDAVTRVLDGTRRRPRGSPRQL